MFLTENGCLFKIPEENFWWKKNPEDFLLRSTDEVIDETSCVNRVCRLIKE